MKEPLVAALDTMSVIWGVTDAERISGGADRPGEKEPALRAQILIRNLERENATVVISTITVAEVLAGIPDQKHASVIEALRAKFEVVNYGLDAARLAAGLFRKYKANKPQISGGRNILKNDLHIIASVYVFGARYFYSHDELARAIAQDVGLVARDLPTHSNYLFDELS